MSVPVVTWQWHCCHLVPPAEMPPPHTAAAATAAFTPAKTALQPFCALHPNGKLTLLTQSRHRKSITFKCLLGSICIILVFVWVHQYWQLQEKGFCYQEHGKRWRVFQRFLRKGNRIQRDHTHLYMDKPADNMQKCVPVQAERTNNPCNKQAAQEKLQLVMRGTI